MIEIGSDEHKERFCRQFVASHRRYRPESLAWPDLDASARERLRAIPFWPQVLFTEQRAGAIVDAYAATMPTRSSARRWRCKASRKPAMPIFCG
jgi:hypothetical protein